jgi:hypothetical protein
VRRGASWTAAYHLQLIVAAVARSLRPSVGASASLLLNGPGGCSPRRRLPGAASSRYQEVGRRRRGRHCQQARHGVGRRCPACGVHPSGFGVRDPAVQPSGVRSPGMVVLQRVRRSAGCCPPVCCPTVRCPAVRCPAVRCPAVWCLPRRSGRVHLLPPQAVAVGTRSRWPGDRDHQNRWRPRWLPSRRRLDQRSRRPGRGATLPKSRWSMGGGWLSGVKC